MSPNPIVPPGGCCFNPRDLAWDGTNLWAGYQSVGLIYKLDPADGTVLDSFDSPSGSLQQGLTWDGQYLWHLMEFFSEIAHGLPKDEDCWQVLDREALLGVVDNGGDFFFHDEHGSSVGVRLLHALVWAVGADILAPITCRV